MFSILRAVMAEWETLSNIDREQTMAALVVAVEHRAAGSPLEMLRAREASAEKPDLLHAQKSLVKLAERHSLVSETALARLVLLEEALVALELQELVTAAVAVGHPLRAMVAQAALVPRLEAAEEAAVRVAQDQPREQAEQAAMAA